MTTAIWCKLAGLGLLAAALSCGSGPAAAAIKPADLRLTLQAAGLVMTVQQQADDQQQSQGKKKRQSKADKKEKAAIQRAKKHLPQEYHQYLRR